MKLTINGEPHDHQDGLTLAELLGAVGLDARKVAVERNREIVPKSQYGDVVLADGDALEIVHFIGGG
ncbi:MAG: sulfur carrier protein ThiS [Rhodospirillaceae bacterium]